MKWYFTSFLVAIGVLSACHKEYPSPVPGIDPNVSLFSIAAQAEKHSFLVKLDSGWWFKSIEAGTDLGRYGDAERVAHPNQDTIRMKWVTVVRKNPTQVEIEPYSNATDRPRMIVLYLQSYQSEQILKITQERAPR